MQARVHHDVTVGAQQHRLLVGAEVGLEENLDGRVAELLRRLITTQAADAVRPDAWCRRVRGAGGSMLIGARPIDDIQLGEDILDRPAAHVSALHERLDTSLDKAPSLDPEDLGDERHRAIAGGVAPLGKVHEVRAAQATLISVGLPNLRFQLAERHVTLCHQRS
jgi:hypothetical protein